MMMMTILFSFVRVLFFFLLFLLSLSLSLDARNLCESASSSSSHHQNHHESASLRCRRRRKGDAKRDDDDVKTNVSPSFFSVSLLFRVSNTLNMNFSFFFSPLKIRDETKTNFFGRKKKTTGGALR